MWRLRDLVRVEDPPGTLSLIAGTDRYWRSWPIDDGVVELPRGHDDRWSYDASALVHVDPHGYWTDWLRRDPELVRASLRATEHGGRAAWAFDAPPVKGRATRLVVDAELGLVLRASRDGVTAIEWTDLQLDPTLDASYFTHRP